MTGRTAVFPMDELSPVERLIATFHRDYITPMDRALLDLVFAEKPTQEDLDACLRVCDIEVLGASKVLMFSYLLHEHPELDVAGYAGPRIKGLINFFRFANMKTLAHFSKIGKALNAADIPFAVFKGGAMKILRPGLSRPMGDVDILVPPDRMDEAVRLCEQLGYHADEERPPHAVNMLAQDNTHAVDIHHAVFGYGVDTRAFHAGLFKRATLREAFGVTLLLPAHEDLFFISLMNLLKNAKMKTSLHGLLYALFDYRFLLADKADFDWSIVRESAELTRQAANVALAVGFVHSLVPGLLVDATRHFPLTEDVQALCRLALHDAAYYQNRYGEVQAELAEEFRRSRVRVTPFHALYESRSIFSDGIRRHVSGKAFEVKHAY